MTINNIHQFIAKELSKVDLMIAKNLTSDVDLIEKIAQYIFSSGGKRIRPTLVLLTAKLFEFDNETILKLAAIVELIHTATLLHDDVVDRSDKRRGRATANKIWGSQSSVLVGDYIYSRSFQMMVEIQNMQVMDILANAANRIAEGEVIQLVKFHDSYVTEQDYLEMIDRKTATLFSAACEASALLAGASADQINKMKQLGRNIGLAFQLVDDALDYGVSNQDIGKNIGDDLAEGKITLPLIYLLHQGEKRQKTKIQNVLAMASNGENFQTEQQDIFNMIKESQAIQHTYALANSFIDEAKSILQGFPENTANQSLKDLAEFAVARDF